MFDAEMFGSNPLPGMGGAMGGGGMLDRYPFMRARQQQPQRGGMMGAQPPGLMGQNQFRMPQGGLMGMLNGQTQPQGLLGMMMNGNAGGGLLGNLFGGGGGGGMADILGGLTGGGFGGGGIGSR